MHLPLPRSALATLPVAETVSYRSSCGSRDSNLAMSPPVPSSSPPSAPRVSRSLRPRPQFVKHTPRALPSDTAARTAPDAEIANEAKLLRNRRLKLGAGAAVVIVVAASIFGAQLKEAVQEWRRRRDIQVAADLQGLEDQVIGQAGDSVIADTKPRMPAIFTDPVRETPANSVQADREIVRQIALLEDRRALLNRQKGQVRMKIERLEERQARNAEVEARRTGPGFDK